MSPNPLTSRSRMVGIRLAQAIAVRVMRLYNRLIAGRAVVLLQPADLDPGTIYVIAANHQTRLDPFVIAGDLPRPIWRQLRPLRFFTYNGLFRYPFLRWALLALGCFPAKPHPRYAAGLDAAMAMMQRQQTVLIFPEGRRVPSQSAARPGVSRLAQQPNVAIIPVFLQWERRSGRLSYRLVVGRPLVARDLSADQILDHIYDLARHLPA